VKNLLSIILILFPLLNFGQNFKIIKQTDSVPVIKEKGLHFIEPKTDVKNFYFIATVTYQSSDINSLIEDIRKSSINLSANAFKLISKEKINEDYLITLDLFTMNENQVRDNFYNHESNTIYFIGNEDKEVKFKIGKERITLPPDGIYKYSIPKNKEVKINKGGFTGMTIFHKWKENQPVIFYSFDGFSLGNGSYSANGGLMVGANTGRIYSLNIDYALLIKSLLQI
jgi:hypothetical protein